MVDREDFRVNSVISLVSGMTLTLTTVPGDNNYLQGGYLVSTGGNDVVRRYIRSQTGAVLVLDAAAPGNLIGMPVAMYPGCDHSMATCLAKFNNIANYGGHPWIPEDNPMNGSLVF